MPVDHPDTSRPVRPPFAYARLVSAALGFAVVFALLSVLVPLIHMGVSGAS